MSWQATAWAVEQIVGPPARKLLLLVLANYADEHGICWPSQDTLAANTGMSLDTVQRQTKKLQDGGFLTISRPPKRRGQWQTFVYQLHMPSLTRPQNAARSNADIASPDRAECGPAGPQPARKPGRIAVRPKPSIEPSIEPLRARTASEAAERLLAFQGKQEAPEVVQNRIARRLGPEGWLILGELSEAERDRLSALERRHLLDDDLLSEAVSRARLAQRSRTRAAVACGGGSS
ncbi:helix-turn-helix domain-containing protein [Bradyrhizobium ontarionense]|uniref:Helix-turn-helix domain-containing protein n=1 Tax=Bradyrhizobium ontarionense TaxID=2898149 RepID=A0ABY3R6L4_9BRAD|nr:helix-turn-helix domain-containing protein [Bradyrhizobium sp. A19]UFZ02931.1 helix-turn-helix domain-containing protein [Bradyrhizobium sp. A19]